MALSLLRSLKECPLVLKLPPAMSRVRWLGEDLDTVAVLE
jgi:hypothetical protein